MTKNRIALPMTFWVFWVRRVFKATEFGKPLSTRNIILDAIILTFMIELKIASLSRSQKSFRVLVVSSF